MRKKKSDFYSLDKILSKDCYYNMIIGMRSNGKTYAVLEHILSDYVSGKGQGAIIRRYREDFRGKRGSSFFNPLVENDVIRKLTNGEWTGVYYYASQWFLCRADESNPGQIEREEQPFCYAFAISEMEHDKSSAYPNVVNVMFDEFLTRNGYLQDEFVLFMNTLSTIIRYRDNVKIFMLGNTVTKDCPYFKEMGLSHVQDMTAGTIDVYTYGDSRLKVAVEYCDIPEGRKKKGSPSDFYFAFDNPRLKMITASVWEIGIYPHLQVEYKKKDVVFTYFISYMDHLLQCEIVQFDRYDFTFIHPKTTPLQKPDRDIIFDADIKPMVTYSRKLTQGKNFTKLTNKILAYYKNEKVFFSDNETGEVVRNYLEWCNRSSIFKG